ncbi:MAG: hypothetical protein KJ556_02245 [Gammaproteobacteria bacterium]|nr:hypothetical protein [Gammaproteobacteria bacterium]MBU2056182.1 hypothetical protein [Gammaproteobacteria bacterium]MBU2173926.1 hypothetical protein [Gammaproteobacteria bacterium]MBU2248686.1 hypothetical protein [Gammaproteobacteria bacterium]MBU2344040.1 hypothetical protein [Gammaproteobacteria bacterium]
MSAKTVPFSARISVDDAEFISQLQYDGAYTPSDKLRALLVEVRRQRQHGANYADNLAVVQEWFSRLKRQWLLREQELGVHSELMIRSLDLLPELLAQIQTATAEKAEVKLNGFLQHEQDFAQVLLRFSELILPLALSAAPDDRNPIKQGLVRLATVVCQSQVATQGEK